jgi:hypothetical protein
MITDWLLWWVTLVIGVSLSVLALILISVMPVLPWIRIGLIVVQGYVLLGFVQAGWSDRPRSR